MLKGKTPLGACGAQVSRQLAERALTSANDTEPLWIRDEPLRMRPGGRGINALRSSLSAAFATADRSGMVCAREGGMKRLATSHRSLGILMLVTLSTSSAVRAEDAGRTQSLSFATGWFDCNRRQDEAFETRLEYRWDARGVRFAASRSRR